MVRLRFLREVQPHLAMTPEMQSENLPPSSAPHRRVPKQASFVGWSVYSPAHGTLCLRSQPTYLHLSICLSVCLYVSQARFRKIAKQIFELKQVMREDAATAFFSLTQAAQYVAGDFRGKVCTPTLLNT